MKRFFLQGIALLLIPGLVITPAFAAGTMERPVLPAPGIQTRMTSEALTGSVLLDPLRAYNRSLRATLITYLRGRRPSTGTLTRHFLERLMGRRPPDWLLYIVGGLLVAAPYELPRTFRPMRFLRHISDYVIPAQQATERRWRQGGLGLIYGSMAWAAARLVVPGLASGALGHPFFYFQLVAAVLLANMAAHALYNVLVLSLHGLDAIRIALGRLWRIPSWQQPAFFGGLLMIHKEENLPPLLQQALQLARDRRPEEAADRIKQYFKRSSVDDPYVLWDAGYLVEQFITNPQDKIALHLKVVELMKPWVETNPLLRLVIVRSIGVIAEQYRLFEERDKAIAFFQRGLQELAIMETAAQGFPEMLDEWRKEKIRLSQTLAGLLIYEWSERVMKSPEALDKIEAMLNETEEAARPLPPDPVLRFSSAISRAWLAIDRYQLSGRKEEKWLREAEKQMQLARTLDPDQITLRHLSASLYVLRRAYAEAIPLLEETLGTGSIYIRINLFEAYMRSGNMQGAKSVFHRVLEQNPDSVLIPYFEGRMRFSEAESQAPGTTEAKTLYEQALARWEEGIAAGLLHNLQAVFEFSTLAEFMIIAWLRVGLWEKALNGIFVASELAPSVEGLAPIVSQELAAKDSLGFAKKLQRFMAERKMRDFIRRLTAGLSQKNSWDSSAVAFLQNAVGLERRRWLAGERRLHSELLPEINKNKDLAAIRGRLTPRDITVILSAPTLEQGASSAIAALHGLNKRYAGRLASELVKTIDGFAEARLESVSTASTPSTRTGSKNPSTSVQAGNSPALEPLNVAVKSTKQTPATLAAFDEIMRPADPQPGTAASPQEAKIKEIEGRVAFFSQRLEGDPRNPEYRLNHGFTLLELASAHRSGGDLILARRDAEDALRDFQMALDIQMAGQARAAEDFRNLWVEDADTTAIFNSLRHDAARIGKFADEFGNRLPLVVWSFLENGNAHYLLYSMTDDPREARRHLLAARVSLLAAFLLSWNRAEIRVARRIQIRWNLARTLKDTGLFSEALAEAAPALELAELVERSIRGRTPPAATVVSKSDFETLINNSLQTTQWLTMQQNSALFTMACAFQALGQESQAISSLRQIEERATIGLNDSQRSEMYLMLGFHAEENGRFVEAADYVWQARQAARDPQALHRVFVLDQLVKGHQQGVQARREASHGDIEGAQEFWSEALAEVANGLTAVLGFMDLQVQASADDPMADLQPIERALEERLGSQKEAGLHLRKLLLLAAQAYLETDRLNRALEAARMAAELVQDPVTLFVHAGLTALEAGREERWESYDEYLNIAYRRAQQTGAGEPVAQRYFLHAVVRATREFEELRGAYHEQQRAQAWMKIIERISGHPERLEAWTDLLDRLPAWPAERIQEHELSLGSPAEAAVFLSSLLQSPAEEPGFESSQNIQALRYKLFNRLPIIEMMTTTSRYDLRQAEANLRRFYAGNLAGLVIPWLSDPTRTESNRVSEAVHELILSTSRSAGLEDKGRIVDRLAGWLLENDETGPAAIIASYQRDMKGIQFAIKLPNGRTVTCEIELVHHPQLPADMNVERNMAVLQTGPARFAIVLERNLAESLFSDEMAQSLLSGGHPKKKKDKGVRPTIVTDPKMRRALRLGLRQVALRAMHFDVFTAERLARIQERMDYPFDRYPDPEMPGVRETSFDAYREALARQDPAEAQRLAQEDARRLAAGPLASLHRQAAGLYQAIARSEEDLNRDSRMEALLSAMEHHRYLYAAAQRSRLFDRDSLRAAMAFFDAMMAALLPPVRYSAELWRRLQALRPEYNVDGQVVLDQLSAQAQVALSKPMEALTLQLAGERFEQEAGTEPGFAELASEGLPREQIGESSARRQTRIGLLLHVFHPDLFKELAGPRFDRSSFGDKAGLAGAAIGAIGLAALMASRIPTAHAETLAVVDNLIGRAAAEPFQIVEFLKGLMVFLPIGYSLIRLLIPSKIRRFPLAALRRAA